MTKALLTADSTIASPQVIPSSRHVTQHDTRVTSFVAQKECVRVHTVILWWTVVPRHVAGILKRVRIVLARI